MGGSYFLQLQILGAAVDVVKAYEIVLREIEIYEMTAEVVDFWLWE